MPKSIKRENGTGSVYKRKDVKRRPWVAAAPASLVKNGETQKTETKQVILGHYATAQEAKDALEEYRRNPSALYNATLEDIHGKWVDIAYRDISKQMVNNYNASWYKLRPLYKRKFRDLRRSDMQAIIDYYDSEHAKEGIGGEVVIDKQTGRPVMRPPLSFSSLNKIKVLLTSMYSYAIQEDVVSKNYASFIALPKAGEAKKDRFTDLEVQQIKNAIGKVPLADLIYIMCHTGHRVGEFLAVTPDRVLRHNGHIVICGGNKTEAGESKAVPVSLEIGKLIEPWINKHGQTLFCRPDGSPWTVDNFRDRFKNSLEEIGTRILTPHATRRTYSTRLSAAGVSQEDIIALMGHTDFDIDIKHYINQEMDTLIKAVERLSGCGAAG